MSRRLTTATPAGVAVVGLLWAWLLAGCGAQGPEEWLHQGRTMGTTYSVKLLAGPDLDRDAAAAEFDRILEAVNDAMSTYRPDSELSRFNASTSTDWFAVSADTARVVAEAERLGVLTEGSLDVTVGPLVNLWGFGPQGRPQQIPGEQDLAAARQRVGLEHLSVRLEPPALRKSRSDLYLDLSAVAKGYGVDRLVDYVESLGVTDYLVEVGGELRTRGINGRGRPWRIAVEVPDPGGRAVQRVLEPGADGVATSGDYRNYFEAQGVRYSHTIDPATGHPIDHRLASVTVLHPSAMTADGLATAILVMGPERGLAFAEQEGIKAFLVHKTGDEFTESWSRGLDEHLLIGEDER